MKCGGKIRSRRCVWIAASECPYIRNETKECSACSNETTHLYFHRRCRRKTRMEGKLLRNKKRKSRNIMREVGTYKGNLQSSLVL